MIILTISSIMCIIFFILHIFTDNLVFLIMALFCLQEFRAELNVLRIEEKINEKESIL